MDASTLATVIGGLADKGFAAVVALLLLWFGVHELRAFLLKFDQKLDQQSASIARLLRALGEGD
jgi:hypothetical protein